MDRSRQPAAVTRKPLPQEGTHERPPERHREGPREPGPPGPERDRDDGKRDPVEPDERGPERGAPDAAWQP